MTQYPDFYAAFEMPTGESLGAKQRIEFFKYQSKIAADIESLERQRARRAALFEEVAEAYQVVFGTRDFEKISGLILQRDDIERRLEVVATWLETSGLIKDLPIQDLRHAVRSEVFALPPAVQSLVVALRQLLPEDRDATVLRMYWKDDRFHAPEVEPAEKDHIEQRHTIYAHNAAAHQAGAIMEALIFTINAVNEAHPGSAMKLPEICKALPFLTPFVKYGRGKEFVFHPDGCLFQESDKTPLADEVPALDVPPVLEALFLKDSTNGTTH